MVEAFLLSLTNADKDGRILITRNASKSSPSHPPLPTYLLPPTFFFVGSVGSSSFQFLLLNPAAHFREIVDEAHAVVLAGGTMQPVRVVCCAVLCCVVLWLKHTHIYKNKFADFVAQLFGFADNNSNTSKAIGGTSPTTTMLTSTSGEDVVGWQEKVHMFSCGHVIPRENLLTLAITEGPSGVLFDFTFASRSSPDLVPFTTPTPNHHTLT